MSRLQTHGPLGSAGHSVATGGGRMMVAPIFEAETGNRVDVKLVEGEEGMEALRRKLFSSTGVPPENQILLFGGPPYKPLRTTLPPSLLVPSHDEAALSPLDTASRSFGKRKNRVYLFDWRTLAPERSMSSASQGAGALGSSTLVTGVKGGGNPAASFSSSTTAAAVALQEAAEVSEFVGPVEVQLPVEAGAAPSPPSARDSGLLKTIANCGRYSLSALNRGEAYLEVSCRRLRGGEVCAERMGIQMDALEAAVSNSLDHWESLQRGYSALKEKLEEQAFRHESMLETFERDLSALSNITLHPSLATNPKDDAVAAGERSPLLRGRTDGGSEAARIPDGGSGGGGQGSSLRRGSRDNLSQQTTVKRVTLLDCVPVEREYKLLESCRTSQRRFGQEGKAVAQKYAAIKRSIEEQRADPVSKNDHVHGLLQRARDLCGEQKSLTAELRKNYSESFQLASKENWADDQEKQDAIRRMTELMATQENIVPTMRDNDQQVRATVVEIARAKAGLAQTLRRRLREVSRLQTDVGKIQKHQELVRMAWGQKEEQFDHLGKVASMPAAYQAFLQEVARRRRYHQEAEAKVGEFCRSMSALRSAEITARESFRLAHLGNLPPVFVQIAPGLRNMPPVFTPPQVTPLEPGELPEVSPEDVTDMSQQLNLAAGTEVAPEAPAASVGEDSVWLHSAKAKAQAAATAEAEEGPPAKIGTSAEGGGDGGNVVGHDEPAPAEEVMVDKEAASKEEVQPAAAEENREGSHPTRDREEAFPTPLEAENARLVVELAEARARLEELETRARAGVEAQLTTAAATAAPAEKDSEASKSVSGGRGDEGAALPQDKTSSNVSSGRGDEAASFPENTTSTNVSTGRGDEAAASPGDKTSAGGGRKDSVAEAETEASPTRQRAATDATEEGDVATVLRGRGRSGASGRIAGASRAEIRRRSVSEEMVDAGRDSSKPASERRGLGPSREATQKQLVAYRTGLSMLVKLCNQLAAASVVTAGGVGGGAPRDDAGTTSPMALNAQSEAGAAPLAESSRHAEQSAEPLMLAAQEPGVDMEVDVGGVLAGVEAATATKEKEAVKGDEGDHGEGAGKWSTEGTGKAKSSREVTAATTATSSEAPSGVEEASNAAGVGENDDNSAGLASAAEGQGGAGKPVSAVGETEAEGLGTTATAASQPAQGTMGSPLKPNREPSPAERGPGDAAAADAGIEARETAVVRSASRGVDKIKRASERVAVHIRRSHSRIEELLAFEAMVSVPRISMCSFSVQDIALFLPTMVGLPKGSGGTVFLAFHVNCPNRYLSEESVNTARQDLGSSPAFILGRIIMIEQQVATEEPNPYNVASNTVYYVLTAENLC